MGVIYIVVHFKKLAMLTGVAIGGIVAIDVLLFGEISGASMNPIRSLAPAIISGTPSDLWLYWTTPFIGTIVVAVIYKALSGHTKNTSTH
jgi:aquaporin Z